jgi:hypothetical protein
MLTLFAGYAVETGELVKLLIQARRHNPESLAQVPHNDRLRNSRDDTCRDFRGWSEVVAWRRSVASTGADTRD